MTGCDKFKWYKRNPTACIRGMRGLGAAAIGCYNMILDLIYQDEDSCPNDSTFIGGILGESPQRTRALIKKLLEAGKLELDGDRLRNGRAQSELEGRAKVSQSRAEAGQKGGRLRRASPEVQEPPPSNNNDMAEAKQPDRDKTRVEKKRKDSITTKASPGVKRRTEIPNDFPHQAAKQAAVEYWSKRERNDLVNSVEDQAAQFRDYHASHGGKMLDWPAAWRTWVRNALTMTRAPAVQPAPRMAAVAGVTIEEWIYRLTAFFVGHPDTGIALAVKRGFWDRRWGPDPKDRDGCQAPAEAWTQFRKLHPGKAA